jgi:peptide/nickel transport system permease protein
MISFLARRLLFAVLVIIALSAATFCFFQWQQTPHASPLPAYWTWVKGLWGGPSWQIITTRPTATRNFTLLGPTIVGALGHTLALLGVTMLLVVLASVGIALVAAARRASLLDLVLRVLSYLGWAVPAFLLALLVQGLMNRVGGSRGVGPFPLAGWPGQCPAAFGLNRGFLSPCAAAGSGLDYVANVLRYIAVPAVVLALGFVGLHARYLRSALLDALGDPYVTTARAKGLPERQVVLRHALRNSLVTFVGALLADVGAIFGGAMAVDYIFQLNGLGTVFVSEFPVDMGAPVDPGSLTPVILLTAVIVIAASLLADLAVVWLDPRLREYA